MTYVLNKYPNVSDFFYLSIIIPTAIEKGAGTTTTTAAAVASSVSSSSAAVVVVPAPRFDRCRNYYT